MKKSLRSKSDFQKLSEEFPAIAEFDAQGNKHYLVFPDKERQGQWTLMCTPDRQWSIHGKGDTYCDPAEQPLDPVEVPQFLWNHRASINQALKKKA